MATTEHKIEDFAEELGKLLGTAEAKARGWLSQREQIAKTLAGIRDTASKLLEDLGHDAQRVVQRRGRPVKAAVASTVARVKKAGRRGWSTAQRAEAAERMKKYWAQRRKAEKERR